MRKFVEQLGCSKVIVKSDNWPAILALREAVRTEAGMEIVVEEAPAGDHQANGGAENVAKKEQG